MDTPSRSNGRDGALGQADRVKRLTLLAIAGAISGLLSGLGAQVVLTQSGHLNVGLRRGWPALSDISFGIVFGVVFGVAVALFKLPKRYKRLEKLFLPGLVLVALVLAIFVVAPPASAQVSCDVLVTIEGRTTSLIETTRDVPLLINLDTTTELQFAASAEGIADGIVEVAVVSVSPFGFLVEPGGTVVYYDQITGGGSSTLLRIKKSGPTGFIVAAPGFTSSVLPLGLVELSIIVDDLSNREVGPVCSHTAWIQPVARPATNLFGFLGASASAVGLAGLAAVRIGRRKLDRTSSPASPEPPPPLQIPATGPHVPAIEARIVDGRGDPVPIGAALAKNVEYVLGLNIGPSVGERDRDPGKENHLVIFGRSSGVDIQPQLGFNFAGVPIPLSLPFVPRRVGRQRIRLALLCNGQLTQLETIELTVADGEQRTTTTLTQSTRTVYAGSSLSSANLVHQQPRSLLVVLDRDESGFVDIQMFGERDGKPVSFGGKQPVEVLTKASDNMRRQFQAVLGMGPGQNLSVKRIDMLDVLTPLAAAGRNLHMALFPAGSQLRLNSDEITQLVGEGSIVQVVQGQAGLGSTTIPWQFLYDQPFLPRATGNRLCADYHQHPVDACPNRDDPEVMCPTGLWGYRAIMEEPLISTHGGVLASPIGIKGDFGLSFASAELTDTPRLTEALAQVGMRRAANFEELIESFGEESDRLGLVYMYTQHAEDAHTETRGIAIGQDMLTAVSFDALKLTWPSQPLVVITSCGQHNHRLTDPFILLNEFRRAGAAGVVTTECTVWDPLAGQLSEQVIRALVDGAEVGPTLRELRRSLLVEHNNPIGFAYRLLALSDTAMRPGGGVAATDREGSE